MKIKEKIINVFVKIITLGVLAYLFQYGWNLEMVKIFNLTKITFNDSLWILIMILVVITMCKDWPDFHE